MEEEIEVNGFKHVRLKHESVNEDEMIKLSRGYYERLDSRRSVRELSDKSVPREVIENLILSASTAPSGAHKQPWIFCAVSNSELKTKIRNAAEKEEKKSYDNRMSDRWLKDLAPLGTDMNKPFLEKAPWLIIVFKQAYTFDDDRGSGR